MQAFASETSLQAAGYRSYRVTLQNGVQTVGRKTSWAKDVRLGELFFWATDDWATTVISTFRRKTVGRQKPKQFASQCSTLVRNSVVRATIEVNGKPSIWVAIAP